MARQARDDLFDQSTPIGRLSLVQVAMWPGTPSSRSRWPARCSSLFRRPRRRARCSTTSSSPWPRSPSSRHCSVRSSTAAAGLAAPWSFSPPSAGPLSARSWPCTSTRSCCSRWPSWCSFSPSCTWSPGGSRARGRRHVRPRREREQTQYATLNARLTLLGTIAGFVVALPGGLIWKIGGSAALLSLDPFVFVGAAVAGFRLPTFTRPRVDQSDQMFAGSDFDTPPVEPGRRTWPVCNLSPTPKCCWGCPRCRSSGDFRASRSSSSPSVCAG